MLVRGEMEDQKPAAAVTAPIPEPDDAGQRNGAVPFERVRAAGFEVKMVGRDGEFGRDTLEVAGKSGQAEGYHGQDRQDRQHPGSRARRSAGEAVAMEQIAEPDEKAGGKEHGEGQPAAVRTARMRTHNGASRVLSML